MAKIGLKALRHSYLANPTAEADWALRQIDLDWSDGGAYALLGPSGCGKTTLLNIISGLVTPSEGTVLFDDRDVTALAPDQRNIAQVFQFPVIYDTMTVYNNLAFPLRNRGIDEVRVDTRVREIAEMLELTEMLGQRASGLSPDGKQKISMGRGLVREDVNVIMFDEPLTVIDPHLKWKLRSKLKELHQKVRVTIIYVTHDQTEALPFADRSIDLVTSRVSAHHFRDFEKALDEAQRALKKGGSLLMADSIAPEDDAICEWMNRIELRRDFSHVENRKISKIQEMLADRGFTVVENDYPRIYLRFNEWTARTKVSADETEALRKDFLEASAATREAFQVAPVHGDIAFSWPCWVFRAVKG